MSYQRLKQPSQSRATSLLQAGIRLGGHNPSHMWWSLPKCQFGQCVNFNEKLFLEIRTLVRVIGCCHSLCRAAAESVEGQCRQKHFYVEFMDWMCQVPLLGRRSCWQMQFPSVPNLLVSPYSLKTSQNPWLFTLKKNGDITWNRIVSLIALWQMLCDKYRKL